MVEFWPGLQGFFWRLLQVGSNPGSPSQESDFLSLDHAVKFNSGRLRLPHNRLQDAQGSLVKFWTSQIAESEQLSHSVSKSDPVVTLQPLCKDTL